jgi:hypothetical protein
MTTYSERLDQLALSSSIMVQVLLGRTPGDMEFVPLKPRPASAEMWEGLHAQWPGRGLRLAGSIGLVDGAPQLVLKEPLGAVQVEALAVAFAAYIGCLVKSALTADTFAAEIERAEVSELERIYAYSDGPRYIN